MPYSSSEVAGMLEQAVLLKERGNALLKRERCDEAIEMYTAAIDVLERITSSRIGALEVRRPLAICHSNRSFALCKVGRASSALADAERALAVDPLYSKAQLRRRAARDLLAQSAELQNARPRCARSLAAGSQLAGSHCASHGVDAASTCSRSSCSSSDAGNSESFDAYVRSTKARASTGLMSVAHGLSHGKDDVMPLALQCASKLGEPPWRLALAIHVHRIVGPVKLRNLLNVREGRRVGDR